MTRTTSPSAAPPQAARKGASRRVLCGLGLLALLIDAVPAAAAPITATASGCVENPASPTSFVWTHAEHFQAVVFHDPVAGCEATIYSRVDGLLEFTVDYDGHGGLRVTSDSGMLPSCGRLQFDMQKYLANGTLDPFGLVSLVVNLGADCVAQPPLPTVPPVPPIPAPEPGTLVLVASGAAVLLARHCRRVP